MWKQLTYDPLPERTVESLERELFARQLAEIMVDNEDLYSLVMLLVELNKKRGGVCARDQK